MEEPQAQTRSVEKTAGLWEWMPALIKYLVKSST